MTIGAARLGLAATAAFAILTAAAVMPASAQTTTYPAGTDCTKLVGNSKTECANQSKMSGAPDNSNNPDNAEINNTENGTAAPSPAGDSMSNSNEKTNYQGKDCTKLVGNSKTECAAQNKQVGTPDNSNNPAQSLPAQSN
jgi:hypothetical protein